MSSTSRMTSYQRREQLIAIGRSLFATEGFEAVSVEAIAAAAKVSKPIVYEHFGGKEGLYAVVVDREMRSLNEALTSALSDPGAHPRRIVERTALALLTYIEEHAEGFHVLVRDSPTTDPSGSFSSLLGDVSMRVEEILTQTFKSQHLPLKGVPYYAQMLVGLTVFTGQYWADRRKVSKEQLAAHIVNLAWYGLSRLQAKPELRFESAKARKAEERRLAKEAKAAAAAESQAAAAKPDADTAEAPSPVTDTTAVDGANADTDSHTDAGTSSHDEGPTDDATSTATGDTNGDATGDTGSDTGSDAGDITGRTS